MRPTVPITTGIRPNTSFCGPCTYPISTFPDPGYPMAAEARALSAAGPHVGRSRSNPDATDETSSRTTMSCNNRIDFVPSLPAQEGLGKGPIPLPEKVLPS
ncbi:Uncharacterized protein HZ326_30766 [Fusarium oxysporum f. sp. albedinis]|nr:Uncharacterized protein HZ326_30766 [Fusarium oxysporum f. sp. albedinis]